MPVDYSQLPKTRDELDAHVADFDAWFKAKQGEHGGDPNAGLTSVEHAIVRSYITWLRENHADHSNQ